MSEHGKVEQLAARMAALIAGEARFDIHGSDVMFREAAMPFATMLIEAEEALDSANVYQCGEMCGVYEHSYKCERSRNVLSRLRTLINTEEQQP